MSAVLFYQPQMIIDAINSANGLSLKNTDVMLSVSTNQENNWLVEQGHGNTVCRVVATKEGDYEGETIVAYDRVDLTMIKNMVGGFLGIPQSVTTVHQALPYFASRYGITFYADDIEDGPVTWTEGVGASFQLKASPASLIYHGEVTFVSSILPEELANIVVNTDLPEYPVFTHATDKYFAEALVYGVNFSNEQEQLSVMTTENYDPAALQLILNANTSISWTIEDNPDAIGCLFNSQITYNGLNSGVEISNSSFKYLMVVELRNDSNVVEGSLLIHYNDYSNEDSLPL